MSTPFPAATGLPRVGEPRHLHSWRHRLADGCATTVYLAEYDAATTFVRVAVLPRPAPLGAWCAAQGVQEAVVGGFFTRPGGVPLGELRTGGVRRRSIPFDCPWDALRACVHVDGGDARLGARPGFVEHPRGDLLQAGPLLVRSGSVVVRDGGDPEGFSAASRQFASDITAGRYPRAALGLAPGRILVLACDGRSVEEAGLTLEELAGLLVELGAESAINLDGGGSTSLVCGGELRNVPRAAPEVSIPGGRPVATALVLTPARKGSSRKVLVKNL
ncbi:MAG: phosphodiester glycosidase family protein [Thermoleophilaceae bacterium]